MADQPVPGAASLSAPILTVSSPSARHFSALTPLVCDERAISRLLETLLERAGISISEAARRIGATTPNAVRQYVHGRRTRPSLLWFLKLVEACGGRVTIEFPR